MNNIAIVMGELSKAGLSPAQIAGVIGRWQQESGAGLNPTAYGDKSIPGGSRGIGQWNTDRLTALQRFGGANWTDPAVQARFFLQEIGGPEARAGKALRAATTPEQASAAMMMYERPQGFTWDNPTAGHGYGNTVANARRILAGGIGDNTLTGGTSPAPAASILHPEIDPTPTADTLASPGPVFGSMSPGGPPAGAAQWALSPDAGKKPSFGDRLSAAGRAFDDAIMPAARVQQVFGGDARQGAGDLMKLLSNPNALAQALMQRRMA